MKSDLVERARSSLKGGRGRPKVAFLRRAVSDAYYALFHALAAACADRLVGVTQRKSDAWCRIYRSLDHGKLKTDFEKIQHDGARQATKTGQESCEVDDLSLIAETFIILQWERHGADYNPVWKKKRNDVSALIDKAETAIAVLDGLADTDLLQLSSVLVVRSRRDR